MHIPNQSNEHIEATLGKLGIMCVESLPHPQDIVGDAGILGSLLGLGSPLGRLHLP